MDVKPKFIFTDLTAIISDYMFYSNNEKNIDTWLENNDCERAGMVITFANEKVKILFMMRWS